MIARGLWLLVRGRAAGIKEFAETSDAVTASLGPLIAFPLVGAGALALNGQPVAGAMNFLARLCAVLALPLIVYEFARLTHRQAAWKSTVAALNWSFWVVLPLFVAGAAIGALLVAAGMSEFRAVCFVIGLMVGYLLWLQWFVVRAGLRLNALQAALLVILNAAVITLLSVVPLVFERLSGFLHVTIA